MLLDDLLDLALVQVLSLLILEVQDDGSTTTKLLALSIWDDAEGTTSTGLPDVLVVIVVLGDDADLVCDEVCRVETDTELANHRNVGTRAERLHEALLFVALSIRYCLRIVRMNAYLCARLGNCAKVVDQVSLGHADTGVADGEELVLLVGDDADVQLLLGVEDGGVGEGGVADFVESIGAVGDQFSQEDLLVRVEGVWSGSSGRDTRTWRGATY